jgi:hypothetical protein
MNTSRPNGSLLAPDDLKVGMYVAIRGEIRRRPETVEQAMAATLEAKLAPSRGPSPGMPLRVLSISLPFVACGWLQPGGAMTGPVVLDVRKSMLQRVSRHFVTTIRNFNSMNASDSAENTSSESMQPRPTDTTSDTIA